MTTPTQDELEELETAIEAIEDCYEGPIYPANETIMKAARKYAVRQRNTRTQQEPVDLMDLRKIEDRLYGLSKKFDQLRYAKPDAYTGELFADCANLLSAIRTDVRNFKASCGLIGNVQPFSGGHENGLLEELKKESYIVSLMGLCASLAGYNDSIIEFSHDPAAVRLATIARDKYEQFKSKADYFRIMHYCAKGEKALQSYGDE